MDQGGWRAACVRRWPAIASPFIEHGAPGIYRPGSAALQARRIGRAAMIQSRRNALKLLGAGALGAMAPSFGASAQAQNAPIMMDGHVHIINRVYWEGIDAWQEQPGVGSDYARARKAGVNCVIDNIGTYGAWNYNYSPKQALRLIETAIDHEGDLAVLGAMHRLGLRTLQFATQSGYNAFADSALSMIQGGQQPEHFKGMTERGFAMVREMNRLGILIDITHGTETVQKQLIEASRAPVVASHEGIRAVAGVGLSDEMLKVLAAKGGLVGIHGAAAVVGPRYRKWMGEKPDNAQHAGRAVNRMVGYMPSVTRTPGDHGEYIAKFDEEFRQRWRELGEWKELPEAEAVVPTADEWAAQVDHVIKTVGADHVAFGLDAVGGRSAVPRDASGYGDLVAALNKVTTPENVRKITGENWLRVLEKAKAV
jgi:membrane dipeptidase